MIQQIGVRDTGSVGTEIVRRLNSATVAMHGMPDVRTRLASRGVDAPRTTPEEFARLPASDLERWARVIKRAGIQSG